MSVTRWAAAAAAVTAGAALLTGAAWAADSGCDRAMARQAIADAAATLPAGWTHEVTCGGSPDGRAGQADPATRRVTIWADRHADAAAVTWTWHHEVGHARDFAGLLDRDAWRQLRGIGDQVDWWTAAHWWAAGAEDAAEAFAACTLPTMTARAGAGWQPPTGVQCLVVTGEVTGRG